MATVFVFRFPLTYLLTYLLTHSMVQGILWKVHSYSACQIIACFHYGTRRFITVFTKARHCPLSWASWIQFASFSSWRLTTSCLTFLVLPLTLQLLNWCQGLSGEKEDSELWGRSWGGAAVIKRPNLFQTNISNNVWSWPVGTLGLWVRISLQARM
jgi:hypothetical protein